MDLHFNFSFKHGKKELTKRISLILFGVILMITAAIVGITDNTPGAVLLFFGFVSLFYAFICHWNDALKFLKLFGFSVIGFILSVLMHNGIDALAGHFDPGIWQTTLWGLSGFFFILAVIIFPVIGLIGILGYLIFSLMKKQKPD